MNKKLTAPDYLIILVIFIMLFSLAGKILMSYPFLILDKTNIQTVEKVGWVRYVKTTGKYAGRTLWFSEGDKKAQILLVCSESNSNYVSSSNCNLSSELERKLPSNRNYTDWEKRTVNIYDINIPIFNLIFKHAILIEK